MQSGSKEGRKRIQDNKKKGYLKHLQGKENGVKKKKEKGHGGREGGTTDRSKEST